MSFRRRSFFCIDEESFCHSDREVFWLRLGISMSFRQRSFCLRRGISVSFRQRSFLASTRNLFVISTEKLFGFDEESQCHSDEEVFWLRRGISMSFRQRSFCLRRGISMSFRQRSSFSSTRNLNVIPTEKFFSFDEESQCHSDREALFLRRGISMSFRQRSFCLRRGISMSFRQRSFLASTRNLNVIPTEKLFSFDEESIVLSIKRDSSVAYRLFQNDSCVL
jgi:hypothetical protein